MKQNGTRKVNIRNLAQWLVSRNVSVRSNTASRILHHYHIWDGAWNPPASHQEEWDNLMVTDPWNPAHFSFYGMPDTAHLLPVSNQERQNLPEDQLWSLLPKSHSNRMLSSTKPSQYFFFLVYKTHLSFLIHLYTCWNSCDHRWVLLMWVYEKITFINFVPGVVLPLTHYFLLVLKMGLSTGSGSELSRAVLFSLKKFWSQTSVWNLLYNAYSLVGVTGIFEGLEWYTLVFQLIWSKFLPHTRESFLIFLIML